MIDLILTGGTVVTMDKTRRVIKNGAVAVDKGAILDVGEAGEVNMTFSTASFGCMREFQQFYRELSGDYSLLPCEKMLELTTIDAAKVVGLDHMIGSLEAGKRADIITVNLLNPRLTPNFNLIHSLVMSAPTFTASRTCVTRIGEKQESRLRKKYLIWNGREEMEDIIKEIQCKPELSA